MDVITPTLWINGHDLDEVVQQLGGPVLCDGQLPAVVLGQRLPRHRQRVAAQETAVQQRLVLAKGLGRAGGHARRQRQRFRQGAAALRRAVEGGA